MMRKTNKELRRNCALLTLVLIILCPMGPQEPSETTGKTSSSQHPQQQQQHQGLASSGGGGYDGFGWLWQRPRQGSTLVGAIFLEEVAQVSVAMNQFVDALLEKLSLLAEIVIENSKGEECQASCSNSLAASEITTIAANNNLDSRDRYEAPSSSTSSTTGNMPPAPSLIRADQLDRREFPDTDSVNLLLESLAGLNGFSDNQQEQQQPQQPAGCKLFNLRVGRQDLPIGELEFCCSEYDVCYSRCDMNKFDCDSQFRSCLASKCKQKFDYTNGTQVRAQRVLSRRQAMLEPLDEPEAELDARLDADADEDEDEDEDLDDELHEEEEEKEAETEVDQLDRYKRHSQQDGLDPAAASTIATEQSHPQPPPPPAANTQNLTRDMKLVRDKYKACKLAGKVLIIGNLAFGCQRYKDRQLKACCKPSKSNNSNSNRDTNNAGTKPPTVSRSTS